MKIFCNCPDVSVLVEGDSEFIAREIICPVHGYQNNCYTCHPEITNTERCTIHRGKL